MSPFLDNRTTLKHAVVGTIFVPFFYEKNAWRPLNSARLVRLGHCDSVSKTTCWRPVSRARCGVTHSRSNQQTGQAQSADIVIRVYNAKLLLSRATSLVVFLIGRNSRVYKLNRAVSFLFFFKKKLSLVFFGLARRGTRPLGKDENGGLGTSTLSSFEWKTGRPISQGCHARVKWVGRVPCQKQKDTTTLETFQTKKENATLVWMQPSRAAAARFAGLPPISNGLDFKTGLAYATMLDSSPAYV